MKKLMLSTASLLAALPALAQEATTEATAAVETVAEAAAPVMDKGDVSWMMMSTVLVLFMTLPGLALFYGGLVRSKNMLSILMQTTMIACLVMVLWVLYGYSVTFGGGTSPYWGGLGKLFLKGVTPDSMSATFSAGYVIPEYVFIVFQMTFAAITPGLIIGAFAERVKFTAVLAFCALWVTLVYFPVAHMVWDASGLIFQMGAIDFAGGTVVHINAGIAALVGCLVIGKRVGFGKENMAPHSMVMTMIGASMLWVGWFGFNVMSAQTLDKISGLVAANSLMAMAGGTIAALIAGRNDPGFAYNGPLAGLVAVCAGSDLMHPLGALATGFIAGGLFVFAFTFTQNRLKIDDVLGVWPLHGLCGVWGGLAAGIFGAEAFGGLGGVSLAAQAIMTGMAIIVALVGGTVVYGALKAFVGIRLDQEEEYNGADLTIHRITATPDTRDL